MIYLLVVASGVCIALGNLAGAAADSLLRRLESRRQSTTRPGRRRRYVSSRAGRVPTHPSHEDVDEIQGI
jgi:uncharacterized membrane protein